MSHSHYSHSHKNPRLSMALGQLHTNEIAPHILQAMAEVPREHFVPEHLKHCAYVDEDLEVAPGRFLMEPMIFGKLLSLADITRACRVLVIGCLTGYSLAVIAKLAGHVVGVDTDADMIQHARENLVGAQDVDIQKVESLADGYGMSAPYNVILIAGAVDFIPEIVGGQLAIDGRLVTVKNIAKRPGVNGGIGRGMLVKRVQHQLHYHECFDAASFLLPGFEQSTGFVF